MTDGRSWWVASCLALVLLAFPATGGGADEEEPAPASLEELEARLETILEETRTPGVGYALVAADGAVHAGGVGLADVAEGREATGDTLFRLGSVSKMLVSMSVLALVEEGRLNLHDRLADAAPEIWFANPWEASDPVRIVHLLEHTSGFDDISLAEYAHQLPDDAPLLAGLEFRPDCRRSRWRPGTRMSYCNMGPPVAARVVETLTGQRYEDFVRDRFFTALGMPTATFYEPSGEAADTIATLYYADGATPQAYWHILARPSGSLNASAAEMAQLVRMLLGRGELDGRTVMGRESVERMERPETTLAARAGLASGYGLGNYTFRAREHLLHGHDGGVNGGLASLGYSPEHGFGYVFMINSGSGDAFRRIRSLLVGLLTRDLPTPDPPPSRAIPDELARRWAGWYGPGSPRQESLRFLERLLNVSRVRVEGETLTLDPLLGEAESYHYLGQGLLRHHRWPAASMAMVEGPDGGVLLQRGTDTLERMPGALFWVQTVLGAAALLLLASVLAVGPVWIGQRLLRHRFRAARRLGVMAWPLAAAGSLAVAAGAMVLAGEDLIPRLGLLTPWSLTLCLASVAFALLAVISAVVTVRARRDGVAGVTLLYARAVAGAAVLAAAYLAWWGWIGVRTWV